MEEGSRTNKRGKTTVLDANSATGYSYSRFSLATALPFMIQFAIYFCLPLMQVAAVSVHVRATRVKARMVAQTKFLSGSFK